VCVCVCVCEGGEESLHNTRSQMLLNGIVEHKTWFLRRENVNKNTDTCPDSFTVCKFSKMSLC
jgi:hypothetical protein